MLWEKKLPYGAHASSSRALFRAHGAPRRAGVRVRASFLAERVRDAVFSHGYRTSSAPFPVDRHVLSSLTILDWLLPQDVYEIEIENYSQYFVEFFSELVKLILFL